MAWCLAWMTLPERVYMGQKSWLLQLSLRTADYRKLWRRKANLQLLALSIGAVLGAVPSIYDSPSLKTGPIAHTVVESAVLVSTIFNATSYFFY